MANISKPQKPIALPSEAEMEAAWKVIDNAFLHYYQLLYFHTPRLTEPGGSRNARPFHLKRDENHSHCIRVECNPWSGRREEFDFSFRPADMSDGLLLANCQMILEAIQAEEQKPNQMACCPLAKSVSCVCALLVQLPAARRAAYRDARLRSIP